MSVFQLFAARTPFVDSQGRLTTQALKALQALVQATGGDASGIVPPPANVTIIEVEADITALEADIAIAEADIDTLENQDVDALFYSLAGRVSQLENLVHGLASDFGVDTRALDAVEDLRRDTPIDRYQELLGRIESLEAQL